MLDGEVRERYGQGILTQAQRPVAERLVLPRQVDEAVTRAETQNGDGRVEVDAGRDRKGNRVTIDPRLGISDLVLVWLLDPRGSRTDSFPATGSRSRCIR